jgi:hypothetical protein
MSVPSQQFITTASGEAEQPPVTGTNSALPFKRIRRRNSRAWFMALSAMCLGACATHRHDPPQCKGPFTPINQSSPVVSNGPQR